MAQGANSAPTLPPRAGAPARGEGAGGVGWGGTDAPVGQAPEGILRRGSGRGGDGGGGLQTEAAGGPSSPWLRTARGAPRGLPCRPPALPAPPEVREASGGQAAGSSTPEPQDGTARALPAADATPRAGQTRQGPGAARAAAQEGQRCPFPGLPQGQGLCPS